MFIVCCTALFNFQPYPNNVNAVCSYSCTIQGTGRKLFIPVHKGIFQEAKEDNTTSCGCHNPFRCICNLADED